MPSEVRTVALQKGIDRRLVERLSLADLTGCRVGIPKRSELLEMLL